MQYVTCCVEANGDEIINMVDASREVSFRTFLKHVSRETLSAIFPNYNWGRDKSQGLKMSDDYHVTYHKSVFQGKPCYYVDHSAIEYVFS